MHGRFPTHIMAISSPGIGSNLDVNSIVSQLMTVEARPRALLDRREAAYQSKLSAFGVLKGALSTMQSAMQGLTSMSRFQTFTASAADSSILSATTSAGAAAGAYSINVTSLAQQHAVATLGVASDTAPIGTGTLGLRVGSGALVSITVDSGNNSLQGLRDAINASAAGVTASIINDGSASPYRLALSAKTAGAANTIQVTNNLAAGEFATALDNRTETQAARDAALTVNGIAISSASNTISSAMPGLTLNLQKTGATTLNVARDSSAAQSAVAGFVKAYNDINSTIVNLGKYDPATSKGGPLLGDSVLASLQSDLRNQLGAALQGVPGGVTQLSQIGVAFQRDGMLALDSAKLTAALNKDFDAVGRLFAARGSSDNALLTFSTASANTKPGEYRVDITQAATQGIAAGTSSIAASTVIDATNDGFSLTLDGVSSGLLKLSHGTYTPAQLASAVMNAIQSSSALATAGASATVSVDSGALKITSARFGAASSISNLSGSALGALGYTGAEAGAGLNVGGKFEYQGVQYTATGEGQTLTGPTGSPAEGLSVRYSGSAAQLTAGYEGALSYSEGHATALGRVVNNYLSANGVLNGRTEGLNSSVKSLGERRNALNERLADTERRLRAQFGALDSLIARMNSTSTFLQQQLSRLGNESNSR